MRNLLYLNTGTAVGNGTTDDTAALQAIINAGKTPGLDPDKTYRVQTLSMPTGSKFFGNGALITTVSNAPVFNVQGTSGTPIVGVKVYGLNILGDGRPTIFNGGKNDQVGIHLEHAYECDFANNFFDGLQSTGFRATNTNNRFAPSNVSDCHFKRCNINFESAALGEFINVTGGTMTSSNWAARISGGNVDLSNIIITGDNSTNSNGIAILDGANNGHGKVSGCSIKHTLGTSIYVQTLEGHSFDGCNVFFGEIIIHNTYAAKFNGGIYKLSALTLDTAVGCRFSNLTWIGTPNIIKLNSNIGNTTHTQFVNVANLQGVQVVDGVPVP